MQNREPEGTLIHASRPLEVLNGMQPLLSSIPSDSNLPLIETYSIPEFGPTKPFCYKDRHLVCIQRSGTVHNHDRRFPHESYAGTVSISPIDAPQPGYSFQNATMTIAMLDPSFMRRALGDAINTDSLELVPFSSNRDDQMARLVLAAEYGVSSGLSAGRIFLESIGIALAAHLLTHYANKRVAPRIPRASMPKYLLDRALEFIDENLGNNLSLAEVSAIVEMSPYHFCRLFKRSTGLSPIQYVKRERIQTARRLLAEHRLSLVEVALQLGFSDQSHFTRTFRAEVGVTPSQYSAGN
jgi:AraC family transcriptional regulator